MGTNATYQYPVWLTDRSAALYSGTMGGAAQLDYPHRSACSPDPLIKVIEQYTKLYLPTPKFGKLGIFIIVMPRLLMVFVFLLLPALKYVLKD